MQILGYHYSVSSLEKVLPKLLEKVLTSNQKAVVIAASETELKMIDTFLWTFSKSVVIPHGTNEDGNAPLQPIWLTCTEENPNQAEVLVVIGDLKPSYIHTFEKALILRNNWPIEIIQWAKAQGEFTLWIEQLTGQWEKHS
jgi:DNA polymerase-3 subunit chi